MGSFKCENCGEEIEFELMDKKVDCPNCLCFYNLYEQFEKGLEDLKEGKYERVR